MLLFSSHWRLITSAFNCHISGLFPRSIALLFCLQLHEENKTKRWWHLARWAFSANEPHLFLFLFFAFVHTKKKKKPSVPDPVRARTTCCFVSLMCFAAANGKTNSRSIFRVFRALHSLCPSDNTRQGHFVHFLLTWFRRCQLSSQSSRTVKSFSIGVNDRRLTVVLFGISWVPRFRSYWFPCFCCGF